MSGVIFTRSSSGSVGAGFGGCEPGVSRMKNIGHFVELEQLHALAVQRHLELLAFGAFAEHLAETELQQRQPDQVLAIHGEVVPDGRAAARAERLALERLVLAEIAPDRVGDLRSAPRRVRRRPAG